MKRESQFLATSRTSKPLHVLLILLIFGIMDPRAGGYNIFMQLTGVNGESVNANHLNWIDVLSFSEGLLFAAASSHFQDMSVTKYVDSASPALHAGCAAGQHYDDLYLEVSQSAGSQLMFLRIELHDVFITSISMNANLASNDSRLTESVAFAFQRIKWIYYPIQPNGTLGTPITKCWDLGAQKAC